jgi:hypothetical protein
MKVQINFLRLDYLLQSVYFTFNFCLMLAGLYSDVFWITAVYLQIGVAVYQLWVSNFIHLMRKEFDPNLRNLRKIHFIFTHGFVVGLLIWAWIGFSSNIPVFWIFIVIIPQLLAHAYFFLTWKDYHARKHYLDSRPTIFAY